MRYLFADFGINGFTSPMDAHEVTIMQREMAGLPTRRPSAVLVVNRDKDLTSAAQELEHDALQEYASMMTDPDTPPHVRKACADAIIDRARGRVSQPIVTLPQRNVNISIGLDVKNPTALRERVAQAQEVLQILEETEREAQEAIEVEGVHVDET